jgi:hypothetical protein
MVMLSLSYRLRPGAAHRRGPAGGDGGGAALGRLAGARRDHRRSEAWTELTSFSPDFANRMPRKEAQRVMSETVRRRLLWHAERIGLGAVAFWLVAGAIALARSLAG